MTSKTKSAQLLEITGVNISDAALSEIENLEAVAWKTKTWGMSWDELGIIASVWLGYPREEALRKIEALLRPVHIPDYDTVMREAQ